MRTEYIEHDDHRLAVHLAGEHPGTGCVVIHGGPGGRSDKWFGDMLSERYWTMMYDQYGGGESDPLDNPDALEVSYFSGEIRSVIGKTVKDDYVLIGYSWGAALAVEYASSVDDGHLKGVVLISPFLSGRRWKEDQLSTLSEISEEYESWMREDVEKGIVTDRSLEAMRWLYRRVLFMKEENIATADRHASIPHGKVFLRLWGMNDAIPIGPLKDYDLSDRLSDINVPVLIIFGSSDEVREETVNYYLDRLKDGRSEKVEGGGHYTLSEAPDIYLQKISDFIQGIGRE